MQCCLAIKGICNIIDKSQKHYAEQKKPDIKDKYYMIALIRNQKKD